MFAFFLLPASMAIGASLVSVPIIIHLINRLRYRRIRWAAMEFLLKAQKRNRRRLIIEQLILLMLRCMLVLLIAVLVSGFLGFGCSPDGLQTTAQQTTHFIVLDNSLSMQDHWKDAGTVRTSFEEAKRLINEMAKNAKDANAQQRFRVVPLSDPRQVIFDDLLNAETLATLEAKLNDTKPTFLHLEPLAGVTEARTYFNDNPKGQRVLHLVSDFRLHDWTGTASEPVHKEIEGLCGIGVHVNLVDAAHPPRVGIQPPRHHDNVGIIDLRPETRIVAEGQLINVTVSIQNFSNSDQDGRFFLDVRVDDAERLEASQIIPQLRAASRTDFTFQLAFNRPGYNQLTATLKRFDQSADEGLDGDDKRYAVVDVVKRVPVLIIDGMGKEGLKSGGDTFYLQTVFTAASGYQVVPRGLDVLESGELSQYPSIMLVNVPEIKNEKALKNLQDYVQQGGKIAFFLGDQVKFDQYNEKLYNGGKGLFPVPLAARSTNPLTPEEKIERLLLDDGQKIFIRGKHPAFAWTFEDEGKMQSIFRYLIIDRYAPAQARFKWPNTPGSVVEELVTLPNRRPVDDYKLDAQGLLARLPLKDKKFEKYWPGLERHRREIQEALAGKQLYELANAITALLTDPGDTKDEKKPSMLEFWKESDVQKLRTDFDRFRETVQYGDPLVVAKRFGKGSVVAFLTTAGKAWNDWPGGCPASPTYPIAIVELEKYLTSGSEENNYLVGQPVKFDWDATRFEPKLRKFLQPEAAALQPPAAGGGPAGRAQLDKGEQLPDAGGPEGRLIFTVKDIKDPGLYLIKRDLRPEPGVTGVKSEYLPITFNVDTLAEGDLERSVAEDLVRNPTTPAIGQGQVRLYTNDLDFKDLAKQRRDLSQHPLTFLIFLVLLVAEQALAVHLSFHLKGGEATLPAGARTLGSPASAA
jgi:hypothetical protein